MGAVISLQVWVARCRADDLNDWSARSATENGSWRRRAHIQYLGIISASSRRRIGVGVVRQTMSGARGHETQRRQRLPVVSAPAHGVLCKDSCTSKESGLLKRGPLERVSGQVCRGQICNGDASSPSWKTLPTCPAAHGQARVSDLALLLLLAPSSRGVQPAWSAVRGHFAHVAVSLTATGSRAPLQLKGPPGSPGGMLQPW